MSENGTGAASGREALLTPCMAKLDRLGWSDGFNFQAFGARFAVRSNDGELLALLRQKLPPGAREDPGRRIVDVLISARRSPPATRPGLRNFHLLYLSITQVARTTELEEIVAAFENQIHLLVAAFARRCLFVHAGCVGWRGRAIIIPGPSMAGKSTLVQALVRAGAEYLSDEYAVIDPRGRVRPYLKTLSLRCEPGTSPRRVSAEDLGGRAARQPLALGLVASVAFSAGGRGRLRELSSAAAVMELLANTVAVRRHPELALSLLKRAVTGASAVKGKRGEADLMAPRLLRRSEPAVEAAATGPTRRSPRRR